MNQANPMLLLAMGDQVVIQIATGVLALIGTIFSGVLTYLMARMNQQARAAGVQALIREESIRLTLKQTNKENADQLEAVRSHLEQSTAQADEKMGMVASVLTQKAEDHERIMKQVEQVEQETTNLAQGQEAHRAKLDGLAIVAKATHALVNNAMATQLRLNWAMSRRLAELTKDPVDVQACEMALLLYERHMMGEAHVVALPGTDAEKRGDPAP